MKKRINKKGIAALCLMDGEIFKPVAIESYSEFYEVSNYGRIKALRYDKGRIINGSKLSNGYMHVSLYDKDKVEKQFHIHRLVALTFLVNAISEKVYVNHINGIKHDNRLCNLEWVTPKENTAHATKTGLRKDQVGENNYNVILKEKDIIDIRKMHHLLSANKIAIKFGISKSGVENILYGKTWKHLPIEIYTRK